MKCTPKDDELERYFYTVDEQGSTILITNNCANIANEYYYDAFGNVLESKEDVHNRITYTGQQFDSATQQYYLRARFYNPAIGRFTQEDIYRGDGLNLYAYCKNNPVMYYDPSGYECGKGKTSSINSEAGNKTVNPKDVNYMQSSIKNETGEYTVLDNVEALRNGTLNASDLPAIKIWKDANGQLWTLDHRRLAAFRLAGLDSVPFEWATNEEIANQMWKMSTKTGGKTIKLKLGNGKSIIID